MLFEQLCFDLLSHVGFRELKWTGRSSGDKGRDIVGVIQIDDPLEGTLSQKWFVECKRSKSGIGVRHLLKTLSWCDAATLDVLLVITNATITQQAREWIKEIAASKPFGIRFLEGPRLEHLLREHQDLYEKYFEKPPDYLNKVVLHLLDSDPKAKEYGLNLFVSVPNKTQIAETLVDTVVKDGRARVNAADSLLELLKRKWKPPDGFAKRALERLKYSHESNDEIFDSEPELASEYDARIDVLRNFLRRLQEG